MGVPMMIMIVDMVDVGGGADVGVAEPMKVELDKLVSLDPNALGVRCR